MPFYDYRCTACIHEWEEHASITAPPTKVCPKCGKRTAERLISGAAFRLKDGPAGTWGAGGYASPKPKEKKS